MRYRRVLGIDLDGHDVYAVEILLTGGEPVLHGAWHLALAQESPAEAAALAEQLRGLTSRAVAKAAAITAAKSGSVERLLRLPPMGARETALAAAAALEDQVAFPAAEICLGWQRRPDGTVRAAATRRTAAAERAQLLAASGLRAVRIEAFSIAAATACWRGRLSGEESAVLLCLRKDESAAVFLRDGEIIYTRALPGLADDATSGIAVLAEELMATCALLSTWPGWREPECLWLTGPLAAEPEVRARLAAGLGLDEKAMKSADLPQLQCAPGVSEPGPEYTAAVGLCLAALGAGALGPDLLPGVEAGRPGRETARAWALPLGVALLLGLAGVKLSLAAGERRTAAEAAWLARNRAQIAELKRLRNEASGYSHLLEERREYTQSPACLRLLGALEHALTLGARVTQLNMTGNKVDALAITAPSYIALMRALKKDPLLAGLGLQGQVVTGQENGRQVETFTLAGTWAGGETP